MTTLIFHYNKLLFIKQKQFSNIIINETIDTQTNNLHSKSNKFVVFLKKKVNNPSPSHI